jgi:hypothetical protein
LRCGSNHYHRRTGSLLPAGGEGHASRSAQRHSLRVNARGFSWFLLDPFGVLIAALMEDQFGRPALGIGHEGDLSINDFKEAIFLTFGK